MNKPAVQASKPNVSQMIISFKDQIAAALPRHMSPDRMARIALTEIRKNPKLSDCDPLSFMGALIQTSQLGLEPGSGLGHAYLIPFGKQVQMIIGYQGMIELANRSGKVDSIFADVVYEDDDFTYDVRDGAQRLNHTPNLRGERRIGKIWAVYACAKIKNGAPVMIVMPRGDIDRIEEENRKGKQMGDVWLNHWEAMAKKTAIRQLYKFLPKSVEMADAFSFSSEENTVDLRHVAASVIPDMPPPEPEAPKSLDDVED